MTKQELQRLIDLEPQVKKIAQEFGLLTTDVLFEVVPAQRVLEGMSYMFPTNFSHWTFGRDYEKNRTFYEHTGAGIPYEQVWNFEKPRAFIVETNPFALNVTILAHVYGHVDYFLRNRYLQQGRSYSDIAEEARNASKRFIEYEQRYGQREVEKTIDAGMSIMWHQNPDPFFEEQDEDVVREYLVSIERAKLERFGDIKSEFKKPHTEDEIRKIEKNLERFSSKTPPEPTYDLLYYIIKKSPKPLKPWQIDVLTVIRNQARCLAPNRRTKGLDEGWATYWHARIMRRLFEDGFLTAKEHGVFNNFHSGVTQESKRSFNWYRIFSALFEDIKERWDKGRFGKEYDEEKSHHKLSNWNTSAGLGNQKIFEVAAFYSDRMAVEQFFTDEFIRGQQLYIWVGVPRDDGSIDYVIGDDDPTSIREHIKGMMTSYGIPLITIDNGNHNGQDHLFMSHVWTGYELDPHYIKATIENIHYLWGEKIFLATKVDNKSITVTIDNGKNKNQGKS